MTPAEAIFETVVDWARTRRLTAKVTLALVKEMLHRRAGDPLELDGVLTIGYNELEEALAYLRKQRHK